MVGLGTYMPVSELSLVRNTLGVASSEIWLLRLRCHRLTRCSPGVSQGPTVGYFPGWLDPALVRNILGVSPSEIRLLRLLRVLRHWLTRCSPSESRRPIFDCFPEWLDGSLSPLEDGQGQSRLTIPFLRLPLLLILPPPILTSGRLCSLVTFHQLPLPHGPSCLDTCRRADGCDVVVDALEVSAVPGGVRERIPDKLAQQIAPLCFLLLAVLPALANLVFFSVSTPVVGGFLVAHLVLLCFSLLMFF